MAVSVTHAGLEEIAVPRPEEGGLFGSLRTLQRQVRANGKQQVELSEGVIIHAADLGLIDLV